MSIFVRVCIWVLGFYKVEALEQLMGFLKVWLSGLWLSYCAIVFACVDAIVMDEKLFNDFFFVGSEFHMYYYSPLSHILYFFITFNKFNAKYEFHMTTKYSGLSIVS